MPGAVEAEHADLRKDDGRNFGGLRHARPTIAPGASREPGVAGRLGDCSEIRRHELGNGSEPFIKSPATRKIVRLIAPKIR